jgi:uncharacterized BrkB/YihY/UPF0761 family membrane protein
MLSRKWSSLIIHLLLGVAVSFLVVILVRWIYAEMVNPMHMGLFIGVFLAFIFWVLFERGRRSSDR